MLERPHPGGQLQASPASPASPTLATPHAAGHAAHGTPPTATLARPADATRLRWAGGVRGGGGIATSAHPGVGGRSRSSRRRCAARRSALGRYDCRLARTPCLPPSFMCPCEHLLCILHPPPASPTACVVWQQSCPSGATCPACGRTCSTARGPSSCRASWWPCPSSDEVTIKLAKLGGGAGLGGWEV